MPYQDLVQHLFQLNLHNGVKLGLENSLQLQKALQFPDRQYPTIHVAGTNGKGSVATKIAYGLQAAGYRVGLYTSPHLSCFRERMRINGELISEASIETLLPFLLKIRKDQHIPATFFEITTFLALLYFAQEKVDVAILETGLGGRLDATNIVTPLLSVITSISYDHIEVLGNTIEAITKEKAGIIKPHIPVIIGPSVPEDIVKAKAEQLNSPYFQVKQQAATFEEENCLIAQAALENLSTHFNLSPLAIQKGLAKRPPCRFEVFDTPCPLILDVAHNPNGLLHLFKAAKQHFPSRSLRVLVGLSKNKDCKGCLEIIKNDTNDIHLIEAVNERAAPVSTLYKDLQALGVDQNIYCHSSILEGLEAAIQQTLSHQQVLIICGSFFIMSPIRQALGLQEPADQFDLQEHFMNSQTCPKMLAI